MGPALALRGDLEGKTKRLSRGVENTLDEVQSDLAQALNDFLIAEQTSVVAPLLLPVKRTNV